ncbi:response regulator [Emticicia sp. BO119]|uniref:response regulator n=1 Tax=Emticicia sp. BO119 TaxID=2757768 RepID=UPI0015F09D37|nr:response regulator [Emticicia sp. BO119]MBA4851319.1 response regulator [Emticicia sp. BO119]
MTTRPIILIEDDIDDKKFLEEAFIELSIKNPLLWFDTCKAAKNFLKSTTDQPFIIFCDINLPGQSGIELKREIDASEELREKTIPFVFYTTTANQDYIKEAYTKLTVQGFFQKSHDFEQTKKDIQLIVEYWKRCLHPN